MAADFPQINDFQRQISFWSSEHKIYIEYFLLKWKLKQLNCVYACVCICINFLSSLDVIAKEISILTFHTHMGTGRRNLKVAEFMYPLWNSWVLKSTCWWRYECCVIYCVSASKWNVTVHHITLFTEWEFTLLIFGQSFAVTFAVQNLPFTLAKWCYRSKN